MKVLVVGSGGREHAIAWKLSQSSQVSKIYVAPGNDGILSVADCIPLETHQQIIDFVKVNQIGLVLIGQEVYLVNGLADQLRAEHILVIGPSAKAARLEGSKSFAKQFMSRHQIPTSASKTCHTVEEGMEFLQTLQAPYVIKADGLAAGKGVFICEDLAQARHGLEYILQQSAFGSAGHQVVIEEFLEGEEASYFILTDGTNFISFPSVQDHKRIKELDQGLNTGGMGAYSPAPVVTKKVEQRVIERIVKPTIAGMKKEGHEYQGILYIGLMIDRRKHPRVIEYNCRFGDPECQPLLMKLQSDLFELLLASTKGTLHQQRPLWRSESAACVVLVSEGYPQSYEKGKMISGLDIKKTEDSDVQIFHAATQLDGNVYRTNGGRVLAVTTLGKKLETALTKAYRYIKQIHWEGLVYRTDIGLKGLCHKKDGRKEQSVVIVINDTDDLEVAKQSMQILKEFDVGYELYVLSSDTTEEEIPNKLRQWEAKGIDVLIAFAGVIAYLKNTTTLTTIKPVIEVPTRSSLQDINATPLSTSKTTLWGFPVATTAMDDGIHAGLFALQILSMKYTDLRAKLRLYQLEFVHNAMMSNAK